MRVIWSAGALLVAAACAPANDSEIDASRDIGARIGAILETLARDGAFSGAVIVKRAGTTLYEGAFGTEDGVAPFTLGSASDGGSLAKTLTAAAILLLVDEGRLDLDARARSIAPEFPLPEATVRDLLAHAAALPDYDAFTDLLEAGPVNTASLLRAASARGVPSPFPPGEAFAYCNLCYDALGLIVERVENAPLAAVFERRFFAPLGMNDAFLRPARFADWPTRRVLGFRRDANGALEPFGVSENEAFHGASNVYFSVRDVSAWAEAWAARATATAPARRLALTPARFGDDVSGISLGSWYCADGAARCHYTGVYNGFFSLAMWDAESGLTVALVSNVGLPAGLQIDLPRALIALAEGRAVDTAALRAEARPRNKSAPVDPAALAGSYAGRGLPAFAVEIIDGAPYLDADGAPAMRAYQVEPTTFYVPGLDLYLRAAPQAGDRPPRLRWTTLYRDAIAERR